MIADIEFGVLMGGPYSGLPTYWARVDAKAIEGGRDPAPEALAALTAMEKHDCGPHKNLFISPTTRAVKTSQVMDLLTIARDHGYRIGMVTEGDHVVPWHGLVNYTIVHLVQPAWMRFAADEVRISQGVDPREVELSPKTSCIYSIIASPKDAAVTTIDDRVLWRLAPAPIFHKLEPVWKA